MNRFARSFRARDDAGQAPALQGVPAGPAEVWQTLQQSIGNAALARVMRASRGAGKHDMRDAEEEKPDEEEATAASAKPGGQGGEAALAAATSGSLRPIEDEPTTKEDGEPDERSLPMRRSLRAEPAPAPQKRAMPVEANLTLGAQVERDSDPAGTAKQDPVSGSLSFGSQVVKGTTINGATAFGEEHVKYNVDNPGISTQGGKAVVSGRIFLDIDYAIRDRGRKNVSSANDAIVTKDTFSAIAEDLVTDDQGVPTRATYWASDLTEKHEKFHAQDDIQRATAYVPAATAYLNTQTISDPSNPVGTAMEVAEMLNKVRLDVKADGWAYYNAGGEDRAYKDGQASYESRVSDIYARARKEGWT